MPRLTIEEYPAGEFLIDKLDQRSAEEDGMGLTKTGTEPDRSPEALAADRGKRAPITTDLDKWRANKDELDFPGVDTPPNQDLEVREKDRPFITEDDVVDSVADSFF